MKCTMCRKETEKNMVRDLRREADMFKEYVPEGDYVVCEECCNKRVIQMKRKNVFDGFFENLSKMTNSSMHDPKTTTAAMVEAFTSQHRQLQSYIFQGFTKFIEAIAELDENMYFDARNNWISTWAEKAREAWEL